MEINLWKQQMCKKKGLVIHSTSLQNYYVICVFDFLLCENRANLILEIQNKISKGDFQKEDKLSSWSLVGGYYMFSTKNTILPHEFKIGEVSKFLLTNQVFLFFKDTLIYLDLFGIDNEGIVSVYKIRNEETLRVPKFRLIKI